MYFLINSQATTAPKKATEDANIKIDSGKNSSHIKPENTPPREPPIPYEATVYEDCPIAFAESGKRYVTNMIEVTWCNPKVIACSNWAKINKINSPSEKKIIKNLTTAKMKHENQT